MNDYYTQSGTLFALKPNIKFSHDDTTVVTKPPAGNDFSKSKEHGHLQLFDQDPETWKYAHEEMLNRFVSSVYHPDYMVVSVEGQPPSNDTFYALGYLLTYLLRYSCAL